MLGLEQRLKFNFRSFVQKPNHTHLIKMHFNFYKNTPKYSLTIIILDVQAHNYAINML